MANMGPGRVLSIAFGFRAAKIMNLASKLNLFGLIDTRGALTTKQVSEQLGFVLDDPNFRGASDFLDALVCLGLLQKSAGKGDGTVYDNTEESSALLVPGKDGYIGGCLTYFDDRLYPAWNDLEKALKTGEAVSTASKETGPEDFFDGLTVDMQEVFAYAMVGASNEPNTVLASKFDFSSYKRFGDMGGSTGNLAVRVAQHNPHMHCATYDRSELEPIATKYVANQGISDRVEVVSLNFFTDDFPTDLDVIAMGQILHDWGTEKKLFLMRRVYDALPTGGAFIAIDSYIDDDRSKPESVHGVMMSLNMLVETGKENGYDYTFKEFQEWAQEVGFSKCDMLLLTPVMRACIAYK